MIYINEPLRQKLPAFYSFMGGFNFIGSTQGLNKLTHAPRHWRGTKIKINSISRPSYQNEVQTTVYENGILMHCNHTNQELEIVEFNAGTQFEYSGEVSICQKCGDGWDKDGEQVVTR